MTDPLYGYVPKDNLYVFQLIPVPEDADQNWYRVSYDPDFDYMDHKYNPDTGKWEHANDATNQRISARRREAYIQRADPIFQEWQTDQLLLELGIKTQAQADATKKRWSDMILAIRAEFPYIEVD